MDQAKRNKCSSAMTRMREVTASRRRARSRRDISGRKSGWYCTVDFDPWQPHLLRPVPREGRSIPLQGEPPTGNFSGAGTRSRRFCVLPRPAAKAISRLKCQAVRVCPSLTSSMLGAWLMFFLWSRPGCVRRWANRTRAPRSPSSVRTASRCCASSDRDRDGEIVRYATLGMSAQPMADPTAVARRPGEGPARRTGPLRTGRRSPTPTRCCARSRCSPRPRRSRA